MKKFLPIALVLLFSGVALAQPPTPVPSVDGYRVTFLNTDVVQVMPAPVIVKGVELNDPSLVSKTYPTGTIAKPQCGCSGSCICN